MGFLLTRFLILLFGLSLLRLLPVLGAPSASSHDSHVFFSKEGDSPFKINYAVVRLPFNITATREAASAVRQILHKYATTNPKHHIEANLYHEGYGNNTSGNMYDFLKYPITQHRQLYYGADLRAEQAENRATKLHRLLSSSATQDVQQHSFTDPKATQFSLLRRPKRAVFAVIAGLTVLATSIATIWTAVELANLQASIAAQEELIRDQGHFAANLGFTEYEMATVISNIAAGLSNESAHWSSTSACHVALDQIHGRLDMFDLALDAAMHGRFSARAFSQIDFSTIAIKLEEQAKARGLHPISTHFSDLLQYHTDFRATAHGFELLLHVPLVAKDTMLTIYRHHPLPIPLTDKLHLSVTPGDYSHVAVTPDLKYFRAITQAELSTCQTLGSMFLCDRASLLRAAPIDDTKVNGRDPALCIYALVARRFQLAAKTCNTHFAQSENSMAMISPTRFAAYSSEPRRASISCPNQSIQAGLTVHQLSLLELPLGCSGVTDQYMFTTADSSFIRPAEDWSVAYEWPLSLEDLTQQLDASHLEHLIKDADHLLNETESLAMHAALKGLRPAPPPPDTHFFSTEILLWSVLLTALFFSGLAIFLITVINVRMGRRLYTVHHRLTNVEEDMCAIRFPSTLPVTWPPRSPRPSKRPSERGEPRALKRTRSHPSKERQEAIQAQMMESAESYGPVLRPSPRPSPRPLAPVAALPRPKQ